MCRLFRIVPVRECIVVRVTASAKRRSALTGTAAVALGQAAWTEVCAGLPFAWLASFTGAGSAKYARLAGLVLVELMAGL
jgi:hypothetical protein